jgi:hypothetical protein
MKVMFGGALFAIGALMIGSSATADEAFDKVMTPQIARMTGEINAAVSRSGFKLKASERIFRVLPGLYHGQKREDLLDQAIAASLAFQKRYKYDPVGACDQARARHGSAFE